MDERSASLGESEKGLAQIAQGLDSYGLETLENILWHFRPMHNWRSANPNRLLRRSPPG
jgi:hypothetical protein